jgi:RecA-family ATPase
MSADFNEWRRMISAMPDDAARLETFREAAFDIGSRLGNGLAKPDAVDGLIGMGEAHNFFGIGRDEVERIIGDGIGRAERERYEQDEQQHPYVEETVGRWEQADKERAARSGKARDAKREDEAPPPPLEWLDMSNWDREPRPQRKWAILNRVPLNQAGLFSGEGGAGKSIIEMARDVAHVAGKDWIGSMPEQGPAFYIGAEDDKDEIHIRFYDIAKHYGVTFKELIEGGLHVLPMLGKDATLCAATGKSGRVEVTGLYRLLYEAAGDIKPKNISVDTLTRAFAGNEIDRVQVYAFAMHMQALAMVAGGSVTVLSHPSLQGIASGTGLSGSTAWHGAFRFRQYLKGVKVEAGEQPDGDLREFEFKKNQYGPTAATIVLRYERGLFLPVNGVGTLDKLAAEQKADDLFLKLLDKFQTQGRNVSHHKTSKTYAPTMFCTDPEAKGAGMHKALVAAMDRLFAANKIKVENYGRPSRPYSRVVRC